MPKFNLVGSLTSEKIKQQLVPLSIKIINDKYPFTKSKVVKVHVLDTDEYNKTVNKEMSTTSKEPSHNLSITVAVSEGMTFCPDANVYLKYSGDKIKKSSYVHNVIHELLHGLTCDTTYNNNKVMSSVLEESLTEYFYFKVLSDYLKTEDGLPLSFPNQFKTIQLLSNIIPEEQLLNIYIAKDEGLFKKNIDVKLGNGSYDKLYKDMDFVYRNPKSSDEAMQRIEKLLAK